MERHASEIRAFRLPKGFVECSQGQVYLLSGGAGLPIAKRTLHVAFSKAKLKSGNRAWNNRVRNKGFALTTKPLEELIIQQRILIQEIVLTPRKADKKSENNSQQRCQKP